jgi:hypothetical protein
MRNAINIIVINVSRDIPFKYAMKIQWVSPTSFVRWGIMYSMHAICPIIGMSDIISMK